METSVCVAVLAHGEADIVDDSTFYRLEEAVRRIHALRTEGYSSLALLCMAGTGKQPSSVTMASRMHRVAGQMLRNQGLGDIPIFYNNSETAVWGSIREMRWATNEARRHFKESRMEYVTNARHGCRVRLTSRMLGFGECEVVVSPDKVPPVHHEVLAYLNLAVHMMRCGWIFAPLRRRLYSGG